MDIPKLDYGDFYKFVASLGFLFVVVGLGVGIFAGYRLMPKHPVIFISLATLILVVGVWLGVCLMKKSLKKWHENQKLLDRKLKAETILIESQTQQLLTSPIAPTPPASANIALVICKIASAFSGTIAFDFLKEWRAWFAIENHELRKYKAYVKLRFICGDYKEDVPEGHYGGTLPWNLDALSSIIAPGLGVPDLIKIKASNGAQVKITIFCTVKNENDQLVEEKSPMTYIYDAANKNWFYQV